MSIILEVLVVRSSFLSLISPLFPIFVPLVHLHSRQIFYHSSQPAITCSKLTIETPEQGVKYVQS